MRLWITKDEEGLCLWRTKPALNEMGFGGKMMKTMKKLILASITLLLATQTFLKREKL